MQSFTKRRRTSQISSSHGSMAAPPWGIKNNCQNVCHEQLKQYVFWKYCFCGIDGVSVRAFPHQGWIDTKPIGKKMKHYTIQNYKKDRYGKSVIISCQEFPFRWSYTTILICHEKVTKSFGFKLPVEAYPKRLLFYSSRSKTTLVR